MGLGIHSVMSLAVESAATRVSTIRHVAWAPTGELDPREWATVGRRIGAVGRNIQWLLGDWIAYGNQKFGERYVRASKITGYDTQTLMNMVYVASRFENSRRRENLSWSHHETLASLESGEQDSWLDQAIAHRWAVSDLRMMLRVSRKGDRAETGGEAENGTRGSGSNGDKRQLPGQLLAVKCPRCGGEVPLNAVGG